MKEKLKAFFKQDVSEHKAAALLKYLGPGLLVTVGFIDPGNWASNIAAGSQYGYTLLWMVTLSTFMLIVLQHNAAHLGIVTGKCLSEATTEHFRPWLRNIVLISSIAAAVSTALAEILGAAIALNMLFHLPLKIGSVLVLVVVLVLQFTNSYKKIEKIIIGFVSLIGLSFLFEICLIHTNWGAAAAGWVTPAFPNGGMLVIMSVLGAVVMPHNLFLHSEIIQSRQWNLQDETVIKNQLKFEFTDTLVSMLIGWAINSAMILMAAATFFATKTPVTDLTQAEQMLKTPARQRGKHRVCNCSPVCGAFLQHHRRYGGRQHLRRDFLRTVRYQRQALKTRRSVDHGSRNADHLLDTVAVSGAHLFADAAERAIADHHLHARLPHLVKEGDGKICQLQSGQDHPLVNWTRCDGFEYRAPNQLVSIEFC